MVLGGGHQCFICSCLWIFQQQRCSNARRGLLRGFVWYELCLLCMKKALLQGVLGRASLFFGVFSFLFQGACLTSSYCLHLFGFHALLHNFYILRCVSPPAAPLRPPQCCSGLCKISRSSVPAVSPWLLPSLSSCPASCAAVQSICLYSLTADPLPEQLKAG